jgi:thiosulfate/3-mercaptopyruvate sulfurtransferase
MESSMHILNRRAMLATFGFCSAGTLLKGAAQTEPWTSDELMQPAELARLMNSGDEPVVLCVAFPILYKQRHIAHAKFAGPAGNERGLADLRTVAATLPRTTPVVVYCGCCPMKRCPNIRPAYRELKRMGLQHVHVLSIPTNFHTDWVTKGYPVES